MVWPSPELVTVTLYTGASRLHLPVRSKRGDDLSLPGFAEPVGAAPLAHETLRPPQRRRELARDIASGAATITAYFDRGSEHLSGTDLTFGSNTVLRHRIRDDDPLSAEVEAASTSEMARGSWQIRTETRTRFSSTRVEFLISASLEAFEGDTQVFQKAWERRIPRDGV